jgi:ubiquinone biosynthesis protein Coq4
LTVREARAAYFRKAGFSELGYTDRWVKLRAGPMPLWFPNTKARVRSVKLHDLHHVATGYDTTWTGEAEIGAWELAAGCGRHYAAWILDLFAVLIGLAIAPRRTWRAWRRGRRSRSLYALRELDEALLEESVEVLRDRLGLADLPGPG